MRHSFLQADEGLTQILLERPEPVFLDYVLFFVAGAAVEPRVFAVELVAGEGMIETLLATLPVNELEIEAVVLDVAVFAEGMVGPGVESLAPI